MQIELLGPTPYAEVDAGRIQQAITNLLTNALRHTSSGDKIWVSVEQQGIILQITIRDSGDGIDPEHLPYVFDRFYRTDSARSRDRGGAGLGLAIAKAIIEAHEGEITANSPGPGQGAIFEIRFKALTEPPSV